MTRGCCCVPYTPRTLYSSLSALDASDGSLLHIFDVVWPVFQGQTGGGYMGVAIALNSTHIFHLGIGTGSYFQTATEFTLSCYDKTTYGLVWYVRVTSAFPGGGVGAQDMWMHADDSYVWVASDIGSAWCYDASDGSLQGIATGLVGSKFITSGTAEGKVQFGPMAEYDHEFTELQATDISLPLRYSFSDATQHVASFFDNSGFSELKIYTVPKSALDTETLAVSVSSDLAVYTGYDGSSLIANDGFGTTKQYDLTGTVEWTESNPAQYSYAIGGSATHWFLANSWVYKVSKSDGSEVWRSDDAGLSGDPQDGIYDAVNGNLIVARGKSGPVSLKAIRDSDGSTVWTAEIYGYGNQVILDDGIVYTPHLRQSIGLI